jgi:hypothetical protein
MPTIKNIYGEHIEVDLVEREDYGLAAVGGLLALFGIIATIIVVLSPYTILFAIPTGIVAIGVLLRLHAMKHFEYKVYIRNDCYSWVYIRKKTPEQDQVAVCKAAKKLELRLKNLNEGETLVEKLAEGCK